MPGSDHLDALSHGGGDPLHRRRANITDGKNTRVIGLEGSAPVAGEHRGLNNGPPGS
jgi:hypothetical protein